MMKLDIPWASPKVNYMSVLRTSVHLSVGFAHDFHIEAFQASELCSMGFTHG
jgi:hypothetical protein